MHMTDRAPVLSATSRTDCIWIISFSCPTGPRRAAGDLPAPSGQRPGGHNLPAEVPPPAGACTSMLLFDAPA
jgi:hypothetical protein